MTPEQAQQLLQEVARGVSLSTPTYLLLFGFWIVGLALAGAIGGFFSQRGKTAAIERDLATITKQLERTTSATEMVKAEITGGTWVKQERWRLRADLYRRILEELYAAGNLYADILEPLSGGRRASPANLREYLESVQTKVSESSDRLRRAVALGRVFLSDEAQAVLTRFDEAMAVASETSELTPTHLQGIARTIGETREGITVAARNDLLGL